MMIEMPVKRRDMLVREIDGEGVIYDRLHRKVHALNVTANVVWDLCDGYHKVDDIVEHLRSRFDVPVTLARGDVLRIIETFREVGLLEI
ncbi:MAG: PqqD family protein [Candidatus Latescibacteria bacterium]|nr:PqqD family protein [Candidatus Latescibacterota bacterium]